MADQNKDRGSSPAHEDSDMERARRDLAEGRTVGRGMTSPDSTQVPLSAETGEPDERTRSDASRKDRDEQSGSSGGSGDRSGKR